MDNKTRMENAMAYIVDETLVTEMKQNKRLTHLFNTTDPWEFEKLDEIAQYLYEKETISGEEFMRILNAQPQLPAAAPADSTKDNA